MLRSLCLLHRTFSQIQYPQGLRIFRCWHIVTLQAYKGAGAALEKLGRLEEALVFYDYGFELLDDSFYEQYDIMIAYLTCAQTIGNRAYATGK
jgi:hypothetical protein